MVKTIFCLAVWSVVLGTLGRLATRPAVAAPATATFNVNSTLDVADNSLGDGNCDTPANSPAAGACTLRAAVMSADVASGDGATIIVPAGIYTLTIPADLTDTANMGDLTLTTPASGNPVISIIGAGAGQTIIDGNRQDRVLTVEDSRTATISGVTLRNGFGTGNLEGGGIYNHGILTLDSVSVSGNQGGSSIAAKGGGIVNLQDLTVIDSTIGPNNSSSYGGGISNNGNIVTLVRSTVYGNSAYDGAGIYNYPSSNLYLINSTVSQNTATADGGALVNYGSTNAYNATIVFNGAETEPNSSTKAGGVSSIDGGIVNLRNTLLAGNYHANDSSAADCTGTIHPYGQNLFGENPPCTLGSGDGNYDVVNSLALIGPLQDNGGPTLTHALLTGSNAIDYGTVNGCVGPSGQLATDQRGFPRVVGVTCDMGAYEFLPPVAYLPTVGR